MNNQKENVIKFAEEFAYVFDPYKNKYRVLELFEYQKKMLIDFEENRFNIIKHSKQVGVDTIVAIYIAYFMSENPDKTVIVISNSSDSSIKFLAKVKIILLRTGVKFIIQNKREISLENGSKIISHAGTKDAGKGHSIDLLFMNNVEYILNNQDVWAAAGPCLYATKGKAILASVPQYEEDFFHKMWCSAIREESDFKPKSIYWYENPNHNNEWFHKECLRLGNPDSIKTELDCQFIERKEKRKKSTINIRIEKKKKDKIALRMKQKNISSITDYIMELIDKDLE
jgi:hypothetical protein